jgi:glycogen debranching enzyme
MPGLGLIHLHPRPRKHIISQNYSALITAHDGFIYKGSSDGWYVHQTRLLSRYRYLLNGEPPHPVALSACGQHSWLGYYIAPPPSSEEDGLLWRIEGLVTGKGQKKETKEIAQHALELRLSRFVGNGMHEDIDLTNYTGSRVEFTLQLELDADFIDQREAKKRRQVTGTLTRQWSEDKRELAFDYQAEHKYRLQGERGTAHLHRGLIVPISEADSPPVYEKDGISFTIALDPKASWHACIQLIPVQDGQPAQPVYGCRSFFGRSANAFDSKRRAFLNDSTALTVPGSDSLASVAAGAFRQAKEDLAALRLYDLDQNEHAWLPAAGVPIYLGLFGRDALFTARAASLVSPDLMRGSLSKLAELQGTRIDDWRDEQPGRILHQCQLGPLEVLNFNLFARYYGEITGPAYFPVLLGNLWRWTGDPLPDSSPDQLPARCRLAF